ncbi:MAG: porin, partial [Pseudomonadota bacterium]
MKLKSLLLGTAAAMVAVSGAQAADAVIVEPEPVEYVRVCDAYGSGFFYIPGTETCLRFNGYVRSYYSVSHIDNDTTGEQLSFTDWASRARMQVTANSETDWGTLSAFFRIDTDLRGSGSRPATIDRGLISLAGFRAGMGAQYWVTNHGFAGVNLAGIVSDPGFITTEDGPYAGSTTASTMFDYTWAGDGLSITAGVQTLNPANPARTQFSGGFHDYYAGFNYSADWGGVAFTWMNDSNAIDNLGNVGDGSAWKVSVDLDLSEFIPGGLLHGMYMTDGDDVTQYVV